MTFSAFKLLYMKLTINKMDGHDLSNTAHYPSIKWMGVALVTQHIVNACQED